MKAQGVPINFKKQLNNFKRLHPAHNGKLPREFEVNGSGIILKRPHLANERDAADAAVALKANLTSGLRGAMKKWMEAAEKERSNIRLSE